MHNRIQKVLDRAIPEIKDAITYSSIAIVWALCLLSMRAYCFEEPAFSISHEYTLFYLTYLAVFSVYCVIRDLFFSTGTVCSRNNVPTS
ncbi:MAG: hypothetical protein WDZ41_03275 [Candidatus Babeliales bacterium]